MVEKRTACSGHIPGSETYAPCRHGFPQTAVCCGINTEHVTPFCCREEWAGRFYELWGGRPPDSMIDLGDLANHSDGAE